MYEQGKGYNQNIKAFMRLISYCENYAFRNKSYYPYKVYIGGTEIKDISRHPIETGEKKYINNSSASGAYQIVFATWRKLKEKQGYKDFLPQTQDKACYQLIKEKKCIEHIEKGHIEKAMRILGNIEKNGTNWIQWECFKKMYENKYPVTIEMALDFYKKENGFLMREMEDGTYMVDFDVTITAKKEQEKKKFKNYLKWIIPTLIALTVGIIYKSKNKKKKNNY